MIAGDEGKPMSIMERISDEPCDPEPYVDYLIEHHRAHCEYWKSRATDGRWWDPDANNTVASVTFHIDSFVRDLEELKRKMHRPTRAQVES